MTALTWLDFATATDLGQLRARNEDAVGWRRHEDAQAIGGSLVFVVADGMGGHAAGDVASRIAVDTALDVFATSAERDVRDRATAAVVEANRAILRKASEAVECAGMGTTCVLTAVGPERIVIAHVGDSRAYLLRDGRLSQLTEDHSWVHDQVRRGVLDRAAAKWHPMRHVITRALGVEADLEPDLLDVEFRAGDVLLVCTDGLSGPLSDDLIETILSRSGSASGSATELIRAANAAGGPDNITVAVVRRLDGARDAREEKASAEPQGSGPAPDSGHQVSIIITNWNGWHFLEPCLEALRAQTRPADEVIVVDNGSTDGSSCRLRSEYPWVKLVALERNLGFAGGTNSGFAAATGDLLVSLNNDTVADPTWVEEILRTFAEGERASSFESGGLGAVASVLVRADVPHIVDSAGIDIDRAGLAWDREGGRDVDALPERPLEVFGACAAAALYRREMLLDVGYFDEAYFAYLDDVDLAWRARLRGWRTVLAPRAVVRHVHSGTAGPASATKRRWLARNKVRLLVKNYPTGALLRNLHWILLFDAIALGGALVTPTPDGAWGRLASFLGRFEGLLALPSALRARAQVQSRRTVSADQIGLAPISTPAAVIGRYRHLWSGPRQLATGVL